MTAGRNDPCPCGSGKKYKRCCLQADEGSSRPPGQDWYDLDRRLSANMGPWAKRRFGKEWSTCLEKYPIELEERVEHLPLFQAWAIYERKIDGRPVASWYLEERGRHLLPHERDWLEAQLRSWLSAWEVLEVEAGKSIRLKDLLTGVERTVSEVAGSKTISPHLLVLARIVDHAGLSLLAGRHLSPLAPEVGRNCVDNIRAELGLGKRMTPQDLREGARPTTLITFWQETVAVVEDQPMPALRNSDGDELVLIKDHYKLVGKGARSTVEAELANFADVEAPDPDASERRYTLIRDDDPNAAPNAAMKNTILATIVVKARGVVVETNSRERADEQRALIKKAFGPIVKFSKREEASVDDLLEKGPIPGRKAPRPPTGPEVDAMLRDFKARHYATWSDHGLPALDGLSPREAASQPKYRARLETLLKEMEYHESRGEPGQRFDFGTIRRELGMG
jgi:SEC-C motif